MAAQLLAAVQESNHPGNGLISPLPTQFAPAERASTPLINEQATEILQTMVDVNLLNAVPNILVILNQHRQVIFANQALIKLLGIDDLEPILGLRPGEILSCAHAISAPGGCGTTEFCRTCGAVQAILASQRGHSAVKECRILQKDGEALDLRVTAKPFNVHGNQYTTFAVEDIRNEKRRDALERIFFHDILNTAGGLWGFAGLLRSESDADNVEEAGELKEIVYHLSERLIEEINAQRTLLAAENGELALTATAFEAKKLLEELAEQYRGHEVSKGKYLYVHPESTAISQTSDPALVRRVLSNLIKNALEAAQVGQAVTMGSLNEGDGITYWVHNPTFIPRPIQLQIFNRSFSTKEKGRGLGTYSVKLLSERYLQGSISFTTTLEEGTTFFASYPQKIEIEEVVTESEEEAPLRSREEMDR